MLPAMYSNWAVLSKLFLGFMNLTQEVYEALATLWHPLFRPICELELTDCSRCSVSGISHLCNK